MSGARSRRRLGLTRHPGAVARGPRTRPGERLLEVGPGTGFYTLPVAQWLGSDSQLGICDLQQEMLDHTLRTARRRGLSNVTATQSDARNLLRGRALRRRLPDHGARRDPRPTHGAGRTEPRAPPRRSARRRSVRRATLRLGTGAPASGRAGRTAPRAAKRSTLWLLREAHAGMSKRTGRCASDPDATPGRVAGLPVRGRSVWRELRVGRGRGR